MKVASNRIGDVINFYHSQLDELYGTEETNAIIKSVFEHYLQINRNEIFRKQEENLNQSDLLKLYDAAKDLATGRPVQYVLKTAWFYGREFKVNETVLIPRPETEELVDLIKKECSTAKSVLDIGTGSGCIPVSLSLEIAGATVMACDISVDALKLATENALMNNARVSFFEADILTASKSDLRQTFDVIVSNPPYIKLSEKDSMHKNVTDYEPHLALFVNGEDAIVFYRKIIDCCETNLNQGGGLYFELNPLTADEVKMYAEKKKVFTSVELINDLSGSVRFLKAIKE